MIVNDPAVAYGSIDDRGILSLIEMVRKGVRFSHFMQVVRTSPFKLNEWASYLHLSERTLQRYESENAVFDPVQSERIVQIAMLNNYGTDVFGTRDLFNSWLVAPNLGMGGIPPKDLLDNHFGISWVKDELGRISQGILA